MKRLDIIAIGPYAVALVVSCFFYYETLGIAPAAEGQLGAAAWPKTILLLAIFTCLWEIARHLMPGAPSGGRRRSPEEPAGGSLIPQASDPGAAREVAEIVPWMGICLTAVYVFAFPWTGYFLATLLYVAAFVFVGGYRRPLVAAGVGVVASLAFMFLFMRIVYVSLPIGVGPFADLSTLLMRAMGIK